LNEFFEMLPWYRIESADTAFVDAADDVRLARSLHAVALHGRQMKQKRKKTKGCE
jgi:hypothetical protein